MEGLAERAGVSKALPYQHFDNATAVLVALYHREIDLLGRRVAGAVHGIVDPGARVEAAVRAYFDAVAARGRVLGAVTSGPDVAAAAGQTGTALTFVSALLIKPFGFRGRQATALASMLLGTLSGATESWARHDLPREDIEAATSAVIIGGLRGAEALH